MEYTENTFKIRKETKRDTMLCKAKEPKGEKAHYQAKSVSSIWRKRARPKPKPNDLQMAPNFISMAYTSQEAHQTRHGLGRRPQVVIDPCGWPPPMGTPQVHPLQGSALNALEGDVMGFPRIFTTTD